MGQFSFAEISSAVRFWSINCFLKYVEYKLLTWNWILIRIGKMSYIKRGYIIRLFQINNFLGRSKNEWFFYKFTNKVPSDKICHEFIHNDRERTIFVILDGKIIFWRAIRREITVGHGLCEYYFPKKKVLMLSVQRHDSRTLQKRHLLPGISKV